jgi:hypothetical protein
VQTLYPACRVAQQLEKCGHYLALLNMLVPKLYAEKIHLGQNAYQKYLAAGKGISSCRYALALQSTGA